MSIDRSWERERRCALGAVAFAAALGAASPCWAMDEFVDGPRALALGGPDIASRTDDSAPQANPALLALPALSGSDRRQGEGAPAGWGTGLMLAGGAHQRNDFGGLSEELNSIDVRRIGAQGIRNADDVRGLVRVAAALSHVDPSATALWGFGDAGVSARIGSLAFGVRAHYEAAAFVASIDLQNLGVGVAGPAAANQINASGAPQDGTIGALSDTQRDALYRSLGGSGAFDASSAAGQSVLRLDYAMRQRGLTGDRIPEVVSALQTALSSSGLTLDRNTSSAIVSGFSAIELPVSFGFRVAEHLSVGATAKAIVARVYRTRVLLFDDPEHALESIPDNFEQSANVGIDLGAVARFDRFSVGLVGKNVNQPSFPGPATATDPATSVRIDAKLTAAVAWAPFDSLLLLTSADLLQTTTVMPGYDQQQVSAGIEWEPFRCLALRVGGYRNIAQDDVPYVLTGGFGLRLGPVRLDLAAAATFETDTVLERQVPRELGTALGLSATF